MRKEFSGLTILAMIVLITGGCRESGPSVEEVNAYDVILVIGQSNTHQGLGYDVLSDMPSARILQLGRFGENDMKIIPAAEPLDHLSKLPGRIGFALTFAKHYKAGYLAPGRAVLIIPGGMGATGFGSHQWNPGDTLYEDAIRRTRFVLDHYDSRLVAVLWHQGESDIGNPRYQQELDTMIVHLRHELAGNALFPFILGGMVPYWINQDSVRRKQNEIIHHAMTRLPVTGYADPAVPFLILKRDNELDVIHFDAAGQREMGRRYFAEYKRIVSGSSGN